MKKPKTKKSKWLLILAAILVLGCGQQPNKQRPTRHVQLAQINDTIKVDMSDRWLVERVEIIPPVRGEIEAKCYAYFKIGNTVIRARYSCISNHTVGRYLSLYKTPIEDNEDNERRISESDSASVNDRP